MSKLTALRKQIAALEAEFSRTAKAEIEASVGKVKALMSSLGVNIEHLTETSSSEGSKKTRTRNAPAKKAAAKRAGGGVAKYRDPATGATWSGFGRAPGWIASAKSREAFLIGGAAATTAEAPAPVEAAPAKKQRAPRKLASKKAPEPAAKKALPAKAASKKTVAKKASAVKTAPAKKSPAKKASAKKATAKRAAKLVSAERAATDAAGEA